MPSHVHLLTSDRPIEWITHRGVTVLWAIFASVWLYLACLPIEISSQAWLAYGSLLILILLRRVAQRYRLLRLTFLVIASFLTARYFVWRVTETLGYNGPFSFIAALLLFIAELYSITVYFLGIFVNLSPLRRQSVPLPKDPDRLPTVDVYIPSYNEDPELLETTLLGALNMRYPADKYKVYLLDDGGTDEQCNNPDPDKASAARARRARLQKLCADIGAHYLTRERNEHAKAGNLNAALKHTHGDLIVIFDADHTPTVDFLERTVGPFVANPRLFLVQTPHFFISPDPVERNLKLFSYMPGENEMFYDVIQHGLDFWEASFFCGSAAILRRKALEEAGGFACSTVTEDAETALSLHALGWQSAYINHPMVAGLQPETYTGFITQRMRWAQGMLQVLLFKNPLRQKGLALWQRLAYFNSIFFWFFPFARAVFLLAPSFFLIFGLQIYDANLKNFLAYAMPHLLAVVMVADLLFGRVRWAFISELYEMAQFFYSLGAIVRILRNPRTVSFAVTPKGERLDEEFITSLARPFYVFLMITSISIGMGVWRLIYQPQQLNATLITLGWEVFNGVLLCGVIGAMVE
ncbi:MAG: UDP-forming cellulose synthase catalytic subunit, partial [Deltaproteobacteria bacterium]